MPHHKECWRENGRCTTFACDGKKPRYQSSDYVDYTFDDLAEEYSSNKLVINLEDLTDEALRQDTVPGSPAISQQVSRVSSYSSGAVKSLALAGILGGFMVWLIGREYFSFDYYARLQHFDLVLGDIMVFSALMGGIIGAFLGSVEGITSKVPSKIFSGIITGLLVGVVGAAIGSFIGQGIYSFIIDETLEDVTSLIMVRSIFWALVGLFIGLSQGIGAGGGERVKNGLIGGLIGGAVGGLLFDLFSLHIAAAEFSAFIAITVFGMCIGLGIGMVQEYRKEAWLRVLKGPTAGKEFILQGLKTTIGSSPTCDIVLFRDQAIMARHAEIIFNNNRYVMQSTSDLMNIKINNKNVRYSNLKYGDRIKIGIYEMMFLDKST